MARRPFFSIITRSWNTKLTMKPWSLLTAGTVFTVYLVTWKVSAKFLIQKTSRLLLPIVLRRPMNAITANPLTLQRGSVNAQPALNCINATVFNPTLCSPFWILKNTVFFFTRYCLHPIVFLFLWGKSTVWNIKCLRKWLTRPTNARRTTGAYLDLPKLSARLISHPRQTLMSFVPTINSLVGIGNPSAALTGCVLALYALNCTNATVFNPSGLFLYKMFA